DNENVLKAIEVHIKEDRLPRPVGRLDTCEPGDLGIGAVAAVPKERIARNLGTIVESTGNRKRGLHSADLSHSAGVLTAHHFDHKEVQVSVAVDVSKIDTHRGEGLMTHRQPGQQTKAPGAIVNPNAIHGLEIVTHIN